MVSRRMTPARLSGVLAIATILAVTASGLAIAKTASKKGTRGKQTVSRTVGSQQLSVDPATGRLVKPTPEEAKKLASDLSVMLRRSAENLTVTTLPNGTTMVDLEGGFQNVAIATVDADGNLVMNCVDDLAAAEALLQKGVVSRAAVREQTKEAGKKTAPKKTPVTVEEK